MFIFHILFSIVSDLFSFSHLEPRFFSQDVNNCTPKCISNECTVSRGKFVCCNTCRGKRYDRICVWNIPMYLMEGISLIKIYFFVSIRDTVIMTISRCCGFDARAGQKKFSGFNFVNFFKHISSSRNSKSLSISGTLSSIFHYHITYFGINRYLHLLYSEL